MKQRAVLWCLAAATASFCAQAFAESYEASGNQIVLQTEKPEKFLVETAPGRTYWVTEEEKWSLRRRGINFMDITDFLDLGDGVDISTTVTYPIKPSHNDTIRPLLNELKKKNMRDHLETFSSFWTRYYKSDYGADSSRWLLQQVNDTITKSGASRHGTTVKPFEHPWGQHSIIVTIPGKTNKTVVIGAHQDSTNLISPYFFPAPGADDDGSGTVTILEALRVLLESEDIRTGKAENTVEFHWYSAEEGGLLGSQAIFQAYKAAKRDVKAMLQQDMTGYVQGTIDAGKPVSVGVITDFVDAGLSSFIMKIVEEYCDIPYVQTKCGYACSDHASASKAGYPSAYVMESEFALSNLNRIHTTQDLIEFLSFDHMLEHAKMTLALAFELAFADLN